MTGSECTCPECGAMFGPEAMDLENPDFAPDLAELGQCPACEYCGERDEFWA